MAQAGGDLKVADLKIHSEFVLFTTPDTDKGRTKPSDGPLAALPGFRTVTGAVQKLHSQISTHTVLCSLLHQHLQYCLALYAQTE